MKIKAPQGWTNFAMMGVEYTLDADGSIEMPAVVAQELIDHHGFTVAVDAPDHDPAPFAELGAAHE